MTAISDRLVTHYRPLVEHIHRRAKLIDDVHGQATDDPDQVNCLTCIREMRANVPLHFSIWAQETETKRLPTWCKKLSAFVTSRTQDVGCQECKRILNKTAS